MFCYRLSFFDMDFHDNVEEAEEVKATTQGTVESNKQDEKLLDIECETKNILELEGLDMDSSSSKNGVTESTSNIEHKDDVDQLFKSLTLDNSMCRNNKQSTKSIEEGNQIKFDESLTMDIFDKSDTNFDLTDFSLEVQNQGEQSLQSLTSENIVLLNDLFGDKQNTESEWEAAMSNDTFLPPNILKQSLGDAALGIGQKSILTTNTGDKVSKN